MGHLIRFCSERIRAQAVASLGLLATLWGLFLLLIALLSPSAAPATTQPDSAAASGSTAGARVEAGQRVFLDQCAGCHGEHGDGRSPVGPLMRPPAFDLADFELSESLIWRALQQGIRGSEMPQWNGLSQAELRAVANYVAALGNSGTLSEDDQWADPVVLQEAGRRVYTMHCTPCHGVRGYGNGPEADQYHPRPANFTEMRPSYDAARRVIRNGVAGTSMPAWPLLTDAELQAVTYYIRSLYRWPERRPEVAARHRRAVSGGSQ